MFRQAENSKLASWVDHQRGYRKKGALGEERIRRLDAIGFVWDVLDAQWEEMFAALMAYRDAYGDCNVPQNWSENPSLGSWPGTQRISREKGTLSEEKIGRLDELGFIWDTRGALWEEKFAALVAYKGAHGDCNVPTRWPENPTLANWAFNLRQQRKKGTLSEERIRRLGAIGFVWDVLDARWEEMLAALVAYRATYGDCNVPDKWPENRKLASWLGTHRQQRKKGALSEERIRRLDEIGFVWEVRHRKE